MRTYFAAVRLLVPHRALHITAVICGLLLTSAQSALAIFTIQYNGTQVQFTGVSNPSGLALDLYGNLYIADTGNHRVLKVVAGSTTPVLFPITIGGTTVTFTGNSPKQMAVDSAGNLYIADPTNNRIIKSDPSGNGTSLSPSGLSPSPTTLNAPQGVAVDTFGDVFISDTGNNRIVEIPSGGSAAVLTITGVGALNTPKGLATDSFDNLYIADTNNSRVVEMNPSLQGSVVGISGLSNPIAVAVQNNGTIYVVDGQAAPNDRIAILDPQGDQYDMFNDEVDDAFGQPTAIAIDSQGGFYLTTTNAVNLFHQGNANFGHVALGSSGTPITLNFDLGFFTQLTGASPTIFTVGTQNLDFTVAANAGTPCSTSIDTTGGTVRCTVNVQFTPTATGVRRGALVLSYSNEFFAPLTTGNFTVPLVGYGDGPAVALSPGVASQLSTGSLSFPSTFQPFQTAFDGVGNLYATDTGNNRVLKIPAGGGTATVVNIPALSSSPTGLNGPTGLAIDGAGNLFVSDTGNNRIVEVTAAGSSQVVVACLTPASSLPPLCATDSDYSFNGPKSLFIDGGGNLIVDDAGNNKIVQLTTNYALSNDNTLGFVNAFVLSTGTFVFGANSSMAVDAEDGLYISDDTNSRIIKVDRLGSSSLVDFSSISTGLSTPHSVTLDPMGNLYVMDAGGTAGAQRVVQKFTNGTVSTLAFSGASFGATANQLAVDNTGNVLVTDTGNHKLVEVNVGQSAWTFTDTNTGSTGPTHTTTVTNLGNQALILSANPSYTASFSQDTTDTNLCTSDTSLTVGMTCDVSIKFTPQSSGSLSSTINITDDTQNAGGSTQPIQVSGTGLTASDTTSTTISTPSSGTTISYGQPLSLTAQVVDTATGHTSSIPIGSVSFADTFGSTSNTLGTAVVNATTGIATLSGVVLNGYGPHSIQANYQPSSGTFGASSSSGLSFTFSKANVSVTSSSQSVSLVPGQSGSITITVTPAYAGEVLPSGAITYSILNGSTTVIGPATATLTAGSGSSTSIVPIPTTLSAGSYTISISYAGDGNYKLSPPISVSLHVGQITPTIIWSPPASITYGMSLSSLLTATAVNGSTILPGTFVYTATLAGGAPSTVTASTILGAGTYTLTAAFTPQDAASYSTSSSSITLTVAQGSAAVTLVSSANPALLTTSVSFVASVSSSAGTPTGSVGFYDSTTLLATVVLTNAQATYSTSSLAAGTHNITAVYSGGSSFATATSTAVAELIQDFTVSTPTSGTTDTPSATVTPGGTATYTLNIGPSVGTVFPAPVTLSLSGLPPGAIGSLSPTSLPAGSSLSSVTLTIQLPQTAQLDARPRRVRGAPLLLGLLFLPFVRKWRRASKGFTGVAAALLVLAGSAVALMGLAGCSSGNGFFGQAQKTYTIQIIATSGNLSHATSVTLTVE